MRAANSRFQARKFSKRYKYGMVLLSQNIKYIALKLDVLLVHLGIICNRHTDQVELVEGFFYNLFYRLSEKHFSHLLHFIIEI